MATNNRSPHIVNLEDLEWQHSEHESRFESYRKSPGADTGARQIGCSLYRVPPGKCAFPLHAHATNEEAIYILRGSGTLRLGSENTVQEHQIREGDYITLPADLKMAHQIVNTGTAQIEYLCFSTLILPEVLSYPDSEKVGMMVAEESAPSGWPVFRERGFKLLKDADSLGYFDDE